MAILPQTGGEPRSDSSECQRKKWRGARTPQASSSVYPPVSPTGLEELEGPARHRRTPKIPFMKLGTHRLARAADVMADEAERDAEHEAVLEELAAETQKHKLYRAESSWSWLDIALRRIGLLLPPPARRLICDVHFELEPGRGPRPVAPASRIPAPDARAPWPNAQLARH